MNTNKTIEEYESKQRKIVRKIKAFKWFRYLAVMFGVLAAILAVIALVFAIIYRYDGEIADERIAVPFTLVFAISLATFVLGFLLFCGFNSSIEDMENEIYEIDEEVGLWKSRKPSISEPKDIK